MTSANQDLRPGRLSGKKILITGGASGLGLACAERFAEEGADLYLADLNQEAGEAAAQRIANRFNSQVGFTFLDVTQESSVEAAVSTALDALGRLDGCVASAGISSAGLNETGSEKSVLNTPVEGWQKVIDVNLTGVMLTCRAVARHMVARGEGGVLVNLASSAARIALPGAAEYCVSKAGVVMLTQVMAMELLSHGIRVNAIGPGFIETPMTAAMREDPEGRARMEGMTPMGRLGQPIEIANAALYLLSEESSYTTGHTLYPNGGIFVG
jgi:NAD(P)-dependent dehydrogenase (short-subunit alcohol dehydrogenase family)